MDAGDVGNDEDGGVASSERGHARWDRQNDDGLTSEGCLVQWMSKGGWRKWRNAKSTGEKEKCYREINAHLQEYGHIERTPDSILAKFKTLENSYKKALFWKYSTGSGSYSTTAGNDEDGRSPDQHEIDSRCKHYDAHQLAFGERAALIPRRIYSSTESQAMVEADLDVRRLLGMPRFEDEEGTDKREGGENAEQETQRSQSAGGSRTGSVAPSVSQTSTASTS